MKNKENSPPPRALLGTVINLISTSKRNLVIVFGLEGVNVKIDDK